jgi:hypothetical protein
MQARKRTLPWERDACRGVACNVREPQLQKIEDEDEFEDDNALPSLAPLNPR